MSLNKKNFLSMVEAKKGYIVKKNVILFDTHYDYSTLLENTNNVKYLTRVKDEFDIKSFCYFISDIYEYRYKSGNLYTDGYYIVLNYTEALSSQIDYFSEISLSTGVTLVLVSEENSNES